MITAVLLAAGESSRMGQPKALLPWQESTLLEYGVSELAESGVGEIVVVLGHATEELARLVRHRLATVVINPRYREGRSTSIAAGVGAISLHAEAVLIASVDQPRPAAVIRRLLAEHARSGASISRPTHRDQHGHPTVFDRALLGELSQVAEETQGLKSVLRRHEREIADVPFEDRTVLLNLNTPVEYEREVARLAGGPLS